MPRSIIQSILAFTWRLFGYTCKKMGFAHFCGDCHFINVCKKALDLLNVLNPDMAGAISAEKWLFLFTDRTSKVNTDHLLCCISNGWIQWKEEGVLAYILYAHFLLMAKSSPQQNTFTATEKRRTANVAVADWLLVNQFPIELVNCFRNSLE